MYHWKWLYVKSSESCPRWTWVLEFLAVSPGHLRAARNHVSACVLHQQLVGRDGISP
ncbi:MAG TPA: hypothetical protein VE778_03015 [Candidatus Bathyarchaeia archaeon]|nr:hypothetical protein [Candidatus Bathyarchaeia archaeon]